MYINIILFFIILLFVIIPRCVLITAVLEEYNRGLKNKIELYTDIIHVILLSEIFIICLIAYFLEYIFERITEKLENFFEFAYKNIKSFIEKILKN